MASSHLVKLLDHLLNVVTSDLARSLVSLCPGCSLLFHTPFSIVSQLVQAFGTTLLLGCSRFGS